MKVRIEELPKKLLIGKSIRMSLINNKTAEVWRSFMTERSLIKNAIGTDLYSIQLYDELHYFKNFNPNTEFTKWAAIAVESHENTPIGFSNLTIDSGLYAVFVHKGTISDFKNNMQFVLSKWLPQSVFELDHRPHFELLGAKYKNNDPNSEEEVWLPIRKKT